MKFKNPTAAEAVLSAMERDLAQAIYPSHIEHTYFIALIHLADRRIAPELGKRAYKEPGACRRLQWAHTAHRLGDSRSLRKFADDLGTGALDLSLNKDGRSRSWEFENILAYLSDIEFSFTDRALLKLAQHHHPFHDMVVAGLKDKVLAYHVDRVYLSHFFCLAILGRLLEDKTATGVIVRINEKDQCVEHEGPGKGDSQSMPWIPALLADPKKRKTRVEARRCDLAAQLVALVLVGVPEFDPLLNDADERLSEMKTLLDRFAGRVRRLSPPEKEILAPRDDHCRFIPDLPPLNRPATAADVKAGKAIFHLDGKGKPADLKLPAIGIFKKDAKEKDPPPRPHRASRNRPRPRAGLRHHRTPRHPRRAGPRIGTRRALGRRKEEQGVALLGLARSLSQSRIRWFLKTS
jgi:hypothetical protein